MLFACVKCKFVFSRTEKPEACPGCGCELIREANEKEIAGHKKLCETNGKSSRTPDADA